MDQEMVRADKSLRKKRILFLILFTIIVILIEPTINRYIEQIKETSEKDPELAFKNLWLRLR